MHRCQHNVFPRPIVVRHTFLSPGPSSFTVRPALTYPTWAMASAENYRFTKEEKKVVNSWWSSCENELRDREYVLDTAHISHLQLFPDLQVFRRASRSSIPTFTEIVQSRRIISTYAYRILENDVRFYVMLTLVSAMHEPRNPEPEDHRAPFIEQFTLDGIGGTQIVVATPLLKPFDTSQFRTFHHFRNFFTEICEGIQFMHRERIAYGACMAKNIVWTEPPLILTVLPDTRGSPFQRDIHEIGLLVSEKFVNRFRDHHPIHGLVQQMTNVQECPPIGHILDRFELIELNLGENEPDLLGTSRWDGVLGGLWDRVIGVWQVW
ncbi:hypothetical protein BGW80DRAFT_1396446 [Lactifluus volemus]|nr:hypothetical protein BGW80DRAFT_1396446 [Lactifluus volemus]